MRPRPGTARASSPGERNRPGRGIPIGSLFALGAVAATIAAGSSGEIRIEDPYAGAAGNWYRGQVHAHSTSHRYFVELDSLRDKVERYRDAGFDFVCMTDHNHPSTLLERPDFPLPTRDPNVPGIHFISGAEVGFLLSGPEEGPLRKHHFGAIGMDWSVSRGDSLFRLSESDSSAAQAAIDSISTREYARGKPAITVLNHPEMQAVFDVRIYPRDIAGLRGHAGIEVFNTKWARSNPRSKTWQSHGASHWDFLIGRGIGMRWGFATDDAHEYIVGEDFLGGWILVRSPRLTTESLLDAVRAGVFVACVDSCAGAGYDGEAARFVELGVRGKRIVAASDRPSEFTWWTDAGHLVRTRTGAQADTFEVEGWEKAVRVRLRNDRGAAYSQPFFVESSRRDGERWKLRREAETIRLLHFDEGFGEKLHDEVGAPLSILRGRTPPVEQWSSLADTIAWRDSLWGGWLHNGFGTTPDEVDVDRDRSGYAFRAHGHDFSAEGPASEPAGAITIEWVGVAGVAGVAGPAPGVGERPAFLLGEESRDEAGRVFGWRVESRAPALAEDESRGVRYIVTVATQGGDPITLEFGEDGTRDAHLAAVTVETSSAGCVVRGFVGGELAAESAAAGALAAFAAAGEPTGVPARLRLFRDPFAADPAPVSYALRELRITRGVRSDSAIREDARRLELTN